MYEKYKHNKSTIDCSRLSPSQTIDILNPIDAHRVVVEGFNASIVHPQRSNRHLPTSIPHNQDQTKLKLKFSVDRILGRDTDTSSQNAPEIGYDLDPCTDCNGASQKESPNVIRSSPAMYNIPFSVASMLGFNNNSASILRPLPMRYLQQSSPGGKSHKFSLFLIV